MPLPKTHNELVEKIVDRVNELHRMGVRKLRLLHPDNTEGTAGGIEWVGISKEELISGIVTEEFYQDIDYDLEDGHGINIGDKP